MKRLPGARERWKVGVEVELMAPPGASRKDLAARLARDAGGKVSAFFHAQSEPSAADGLEHFENLTQGFEVRDRKRRTVAWLVDDLTLVDGLDRERPSRDGWFRIVSDDIRIIELLARHGQASAGPVEALRRVGELFGVEPEPLPDGMARLTSRKGQPIAIAAPLPGERERPCEVVTAPLERDVEGALAALLGPARELGFTVPAESATHLHFDAAPLEDTERFARLVRWLSTWRLPLRSLVRTNPRCVRLGDWPTALLRRVNDDRFLALDWEDARDALREVGLSKFCDFNLRNLVFDTPGKHTIEFRILPGYLDAREVVAAIDLCEAILRLACSEREMTVGGPRSPRAANLHALLDELDLPEGARAYWKDQAERGRSEEPREGDDGGSRWTPRRLFGRRGER